MNGSKICVFSGLGHGSEMTDVRKIHVVYICNFVSSIDWQIRFVKGWVGSWVHKFTRQWVGLGWDSYLVGWVGLGR